MNKIKLTNHIKDIELKKETSHFNKKQIRQKEYFHVP